MIFGSKKISSVAIVGAGMAGMSCAIALGREIPSITVFEKSRAAGGRMKSRQHDDCQFDCGAQYFTVRTPVFERQIEQWREQWLVDEWKGWLVDLHEGEALSREDGVKRYLGRPYMHSCVEDMAALCDVRYRVQVARVEHRRKAWRLFDAQDQALGAFDALVVAVPAPEAVPLLEAVPALSTVAASVDMTPCWSVMLSFEESLQLGFDGAFLVAPKLSWAARNSSKPERGERESWILHGSPEWSEANMDLEAVEVIEALLKGMEQACGRRFPMPVHADAKLWRYALPVNPLGESCLYDSELRIGACGDWCNVARVEGAYLSGLNMAMKLIER
ncbi:MAG TPA: FAD-dependent oxidoreductase [Gammaproteobacteria bacterium]